ncbi:MAG: type I pullulanase [Lachnospiraceae bacterium]|nr:type I pullulanase [Lachnospiraceae bacterium]
MGRKGRRKRSLGNSIFSLMLVFVMVISNIQVTPGMQSTVWAAENAVDESTDQSIENSTDSSDETERTADKGEDNESAVNSDKEDRKSEEDTEETSKTSESKKTESTESDDSIKTQESTESDEDKNAEGTTESDENKTQESTIESDENKKSEENSKIEETTEAVETKTEVETTEEADENDADDNKVGEQVEVIIHFKNSLGWGSVLAHYANHDGTNWATDGTNWPGIKQEKDENGYYTLKLEKSKDSGFAFLFHNDQGGKTQDIIIPSDEFTESIYELWVWIDGEIQENGENKKKAILSKTEIISPEIGENRKVTFRYKNDSATSVKVAGTMTDWGTNAVEMQKDSNGVFFCEMTLDPGEYTYKFVVGNDWILDPNNLISIQDKDENGNPTNNYNSGLYVPSTETYQYTIHYYNPNAEENKTPDLHVWDKSIENAGAYPAASKDFSFDSSKTDTEGRKWWTTTFTVPYQHLGFMGRVNAGSYTDGQDDKDREYKIETGNEVELWYVHGTGENNGVHTANPFPVQEGLNPPELTIAKGTTTTLPAKLTKGTEDGTAVEVDVTYTMAEVTGVTLDDGNKQITVAKDFAEKTIELTATEKDGTATVTFEIKVVEDKNEITIKLHYSRLNGDYENWNVWAWTEGTEGQDGARYDFKEESSEMVATISLNGRKNSRFGYIIRKSEGDNDWVEKDPNKELNRYIDLSQILSGTIDCYVESGKDEVREELGDDILKGVKICSIDYDKETNSIKAVTGNPIEGDINTAFTIKSADGTHIAIKNVTQASNKKEYTIELDDNLASIAAMVKKYFISFDGYEYKFQLVSEAIRTLYSTEEFEEAFTYTGNDLGATWTQEKTTFKVWAPTADKVEVKLYDKGEVGEETSTETLAMTEGDKGVWSAEKAGNLNGTYYTYAVTIGGETTEACDPYARTTGVNGNRAMVLNLDATNPEGWAADVSPNAGMNYTDSVIYELHVRDFSIDKSSGIKDDYKGKFLGLTQEGTTNETGQTTGLDYLKDLGVTHMHLLPSYDYATVDETNLDTPQYNWGYDPKNYNVPEGSYSTDPYDGEVRVKEMKQMVKTLHDNNINVIMDVVYNHVYDADKFCFNQIVPQYFSRTKEDGTYSNGSGCGNDTASERAMVKKYIVDSVNYWADEYHIDGFRFDLVGLLDTETINEVVNTVHEKHPNVVFYGEGWTLPTEVSKDGYTMATQANASKTPLFAYFSDGIRDLLKGGNNETDLGFVSGLTGKEEPMANCFRALAGWSSTPTQIVNYASCHDNYTLKDKLDATAGKTNSPEDVIKMNNLAAAIYLTAQGIPLIHAGEELLREKKDEKGNIDHNSYKSPDSINSIKWSNLNKEEYQQTRDYYKGLIAFRKNHAALRLTTAEAVEQNVKYHWITNEVIMFVINGKEQIAGEVSDGIVIIFNATNTEKEVDLYRKTNENNSMYGIAEGTWNICVNAEKAGTEILESITDGKVKVAPISTMILVKGETESDDVVVEKQKLQSLIDQCQITFDQGKKDDYSDESWTAFTTALEEAKAILENPEVTAADLSNARVKLENAHNALKSGSESVDKQNLQEFIDECKIIQGQGQGNYTDESWQTFQTAFESANAVLIKEDATQEEVAKAVEDLQKALDGLKVPEGVVDTRKLEALVDTCKAIQTQGQGNYTEESWKAFTDALKEAEEVLANKEATQEAVDNARSKLEEARGALTNTAPDNNSLKTLIDRYDNVEKGNYTEESWKVFEDALNAAKVIVDKSDATQAEIDKAEQDLIDAYDALKVPEGTVDKGKLKALIVTCDEILNKGQGSYTAESWKAFTVALEEAKAVLANDKAAQTEVDNARNQLDKAYNQLVSVEEEAKALKVLIEKYENLEKGNYTDESWATFEEALSAAKIVAGIPNASLDEIQKAASDLQKAVDALATVKEGLWTAWAPNSGLTLGSDKKYHIAYTGKALKPTIRVYDGKTLLKEKTDYTVVYQNNTNAGSASVTIKGKGNYSESIPVEFIIDAIDIATLDIADLYAAVASNNTKQIALKPIVKFNGKTLKAKKDYTVAYENPETDGVTPGEPSTVYKVNITDGTNKNFTGKKTIHITLVNKDSAFLMSKASISKIAKADMVYQPDEITGKGKVLKPQLTVKYGKNLLTEGTEYTVICDEVHTEAGETATITVRGNGTTYFGEKTTSFKITGTPLKANQVILKDVPKTGLVYTGKPQTPEVEVTTSGAEKKNYQVTYQNNTNVGTATVIVTGKNGYTGTVKKTFKITAFDISTNVDGKFNYNMKADSNAINGEIPYAKGGSKLTDDQLGAYFKVDNTASIVLKQGVDYTLSYKNNKKVGASASVTIKGKGNYKGTMKNIPFTIVAQNLSALEKTTIAADILEKNASKYNKVIPVITDLDGKKLKNKTDFEIDTENSYIYEDKTAISGTPEVNKKIIVTVKAKDGGNYTGTVSTTFRVITNEMNLAKATIRIDEQQYTGNPVVPAKEKIHITLKGSTEELKPEEFEIVECTKNIKKGSAKITIRGISENCGGTKTVSFKITARPMNKSDK